MQSRPRPHRFESVAELVEAWRPNLPVFCIRPGTITAATRRFAELFPGRVLYAVKCNPHPLVLEAIRRGGVGHFDVASLSEIEQLSASFPEGEGDGNGDGPGLYFMHPVKDRAAIRAAYRSHGIRHFVVDHADELEKVWEETGGRDLFVFVRVATPESSDVLYHLAAKFGAQVPEAADLVSAAVARGCRIGLTFHVGSQCLEPKAYRTALELLGQVVERSGQRPECIDVGGGFPHDYPGVEAPPLEAYMEEIQAGLRSTGLDDGPALWAEPGRALVAAGCSVLSQVRLRKGELVYLNDGVYGSFSELIDSEYRLPTRVLSARGAQAEAARDFVVHGPTCDSMDVLGSTLRLPGNVAEGDWIEIGRIGAYSSALSTRFNGFALDHFAELGDAPLLFDVVDVGMGIGEEAAVLDSS